MADTKLLGSTGKICNHCRKSVQGGIYFNNVFYCPMCASIINANNQKGGRECTWVYSLPPNHGSGGLPTSDECKSCQYHPYNKPSNISGGSYAAMDHRSIFNTTKDI